MGSMTCHLMNGVPCRGRFAPRNLKWSDVLQDLLQASLPCAVRVHNRATSAARITVALDPQWRANLIAPQDALIIEDYSIKGHSENTRVAPGHIFQAIYYP